MRPILVIVYLFYSVSILSSQSFDKVLHFDQQRQTHQKRAMLTLGTWATINIAGGLIGHSQTTGAEKYFHQMNAGWNVINLGIAGLGYWRTVRSSAPVNFSSAWKKYEQYQKSLLFNAGLDLGYVAGGFYLTERSRRYENRKADRLKGWGRSIILQGGFLFTFDLVAYLTSLKISDDIQPHMIFDPSTQSTQLGLRINF